MKNKNVRALCFSAVMLALAFGLSYIPFVKMPYGGSITVVSMLPICLVSIVFGLKWGLGTAFCYSWLQILQGEVFSWGLTPTMLIGSLLLDYIVAFTLVGLAGMFRNKGPKGWVLGIVIACALRFLSHFASGVILWANYAEFVAFGAKWINKPFLYSFCYNGAYMLPELVLTAVVAGILFAIPQIRKLIYNQGTIIKK